MMNSDTEFTELRESRLADDWNLKYRVGANVEFVKDSGEVIMTRTSSEAHVLCGQAVILLSGFKGCCSLSAVRKR